MRRPGDEERVVTLNYNIHEYLSDIYVNKVCELKKENCVLTMRDSKVYNNWPDFGKFVVWYGRMGWSSYKDDISEK